MQEIVLASQSAVRLRLLAAAGLAVTADPSGIDENMIKARYHGEQTEACALALAAAKAAHVAPRHPGALVIGADQILACKSVRFDKPRDGAEARQQLTSLRGREHALVTATVVMHGHETRWQHIERSRLLMRRFSDAFLDDYLAAMGPAICDTVGGYALEGTGVQLFERIEGDYFAILGLPLVPLLNFLRAEGAAAQ
ncbi:MAG TPA: Maf family protein [Stellaceae bacterium]|nr:Maf family protein [Stellaceae bacterium]